MEFTPAIENTTGRLSRLVLVNLAGVAEGICAVYCYSIKTKPAIRGSSVQGPLSVNNCSRPGLQFAHSTLNSLQLKVPFCFLWHWRKPLSFAPSCLCLVFTVWNASEFFSKGGRVSYCYRNKVRCNKGCDGFKVNVAILAAIGSCWEPWLSMPYSRFPTAVIAAEMEKTWKGTWLGFSKVLT